MRVAVLSPHRDDAAFSCSLTTHALLLAGAMVTVVNVFTESSYAVDMRTIDSTLTLVEGVSAARLREDQTFLADAVRAAGRDTDAMQLHDLHRLDAPLRLSVATEQVLASPITADQVASQARDLAAELSFLSAFDIVFAPLALGDHIDHRIVRQAARLLLPTGKVCWYEDLPYAARLGAEQRKTEALRAVPSTPTAEYRLYRLHLPHAPHLKKRFSMHYPSQIAPEVADEMARYAAQFATRGDEGAERWWALPASADRIGHTISSVDAVCHVVGELQ